MNKFFNTTGFCNPTDHYIVEPTRGMYPSILQLIEQKQYFLLHAPRQTGKTTLLHALAHRLNSEGRFISCIFSAETAGYQSITVEDANEAMASSLYYSAQLFLKGNELPPEPDKFKKSTTKLTDYLKAWCDTQAKPIVLLIDEADSLYDDVMVNLLRQLRNGFQWRPKGFPSSVALVGLRDIREYRMKARADNPSLGTGSPFNVKSESFMLNFFSKEEVDSLLDQHTQATGQVFSAEVRSKIFGYSGGQPWLTNALAYQIVSKICGNDFTKTITPDMVDTAKENLIEQRQTHLDSLLDKIKEPRVRSIVMAVITGEAPFFDGYDDAIRYCRDLGIITMDRPVRFASPIYREIITRVLNSNFHDGFNNDIVQTPFYLDKNGDLDMDKLFRAFTDFYRWNSESWLERFEYKEAGHQLLLMAFLQRIVNGGGRIEREMALGNGRTDMTIFWKQQVIAIEMKIRQNIRSEEEGLRQLSGYLDRLGQQHGYLVIFDKRPISAFSWEERIQWREVKHEGKEITLVEL
jgi:DNA polymerase III delta prime subunit